MNPEFTVVTRWCNPWYDVSPRLRIFVAIGGQPPAIEWKGAREKDSKKKKGKGNRKMEERLSTRWPLPLQRVLFRFNCCDSETVRDRAGEREDVFLETGPNKSHKLSLCLSKMREAGVCTRLERNYNRGQGRDTSTRPFLLVQTTWRCPLVALLIPPLRNRVVHPLPLFFSPSLFSSFLSPFSKGLYIPSLRPALNMQHAPP